MRPGHPPLTSDAVRWCPTYMASVALVIVPAGFVLVALILAWRCPPRQDPGASTGFLSVVPEPELPRSHETVTDTRVRTTRLATVGTRCRQPLGALQAALQPRPRHSARPVRSGPSRRAGKPGPGAGHHDV